MSDLQLDHLPQKSEIGPAMYTYDHNRAAPASAFNLGSMRRAKRLIRRINRRHFTILFIFAILVAVTYSSSSSIAPYYHPSTNTFFACPSDGATTIRILPPPPPDPRLTTKTWEGLRTLFDANVPTPSYVPHPVHASDLDFPFNDGLRDILGFTKTEAHHTRIAHMNVRRALPAYPDKQFRGRGVIMLAGGKYSEFAATSLGMLRLVGSQLPVEVWMKDTSEEMTGWCAELEREGMACRRLADYMDMSVLSHPYQWKVFVMLFSSFEEFLFLDADDMPIRNPDVIFDSEIYKLNGAIVWPDYWMHTGSTWLPYVIGISDDNSTMLAKTKSAESGQVVWNKKQHWKSLCLATYYNYFGASYYYSLLNQGWAGWGDKDTFPTAAMALEEPFFQVTRDIITVFVDGTLLGIGMVQADPSNSTGTIPMFLHSNIVKWSVRDFLCVGCPPLHGQAGFISHLESDTSPIHSHMLEGKRVFATGSLAEYGMDPEPSIWKVMERLACKSVWGNAQVCQQARDHMKKTFGFKFTTSRLASLLGVQRICLSDASS